MFGIARNIIDFHDIYYPTCDLLCGILYLYTLECFLYKSVNTATREHDRSKVSTLGPYAYVLSEILTKGERNRAIDQESLPKDQYTSLYRGLTLTQEKIDEYRANKGKSFNMGGYVSTSLNRARSVEFAFKDLTDDKRPVLM